MKMNCSVQTNKKNIPKIILHKSNQNVNAFSKYFLNTFKNRQIIAKFNENLKNKNESILIKNKKSNSGLMNISNISIDLSSKNTKRENKEVLPKISPYNFKYFYNESKKNNLHKSLSHFQVNSIEKERNNLESNFMRIQKDSNIYTANADYIKNKKLVIIDKYFYDYNKYKPDRLGLYDMTELRHPKKEKGKGIFGKIYFNHNKYNKIKEGINNKIII